MDKPPPAPAFLDRVEAALAGGAPFGLLAFRSTSLEAVRRDKGAPVAAKLLSQLAAVLEAAVRPGDEVGLLDEDTVGVLLSAASVREGQRAAERLCRAAREGSRWPFAAGLAHREGFAGGAAELSRLAREAAERARADGLLGAATVTAAGFVPAPPDLERAPAGVDPGLAARFQTLTLLNRLSSALFADRPFTQALAEACHVVLSLTEAQSVAVYFTDDLGTLAPAHRHGTAAFGPGEAAAASEEASLVARACAERRLIAESARGRSWLAAPLLRLGREEASIVGALAVGYAGEGKADAAGRDRALVEATRPLRDARLIQLSLQRQRAFAAMFDQSADALFLADLEGRVTSWNASARGLFGWESSEILGRPAGLLWPEAAAGGEAALRAEVLRLGRLAGREALLRRKDGGRVEVEGSFTLIRDDEGRPLAALCAFRDITKRKEVERMRSEFVSMVTHELRTPLTAIRGFAETIHDFWEELPEEQRRKYLRIMLDESQRLADQVTDFLDISRLESGAVELRLVDADLAALARRAADLFKTHPKKPAFRLAVEPGADRLRADEDQVYRLLVNLCGNAVKYNPEGGAITVGARAEGEFVRLWVEDQGPGIAPRDLPRLFEKFFRASDAITRQTPGTGLGLAICKGIVERHGGRLWAESPPGKGAAFFAEFPRRGPAAAAAG